MKYKITFIFIDGELSTDIVFKDFEDSGNITAREWCDDWAYSYSNKGDYRIEEVK